MRVKQEVRITPSDTSRNSCITSLEVNCRLVWNTFVFALWRKPETLRSSSNDHRPSLPVPPAQHADMSEFALLPVSADDPGNQAALDVLLGWRVLAT